MALLNMDSYQNAYSTSPPEGLTDIQTLCAKLIFLSISAPPQMIILFALAQNLVVILNDST